MSTAALNLLDADDPTPTTAWRYRREARRIRCRFRREPSALHLSLRALADRQDAAAPRRSSVRHLDSKPIVAVEVTRAESTPAESAAVRPDTLASVIHADPGAVDRFSVLVRSMLDEGILRHSRRQALFRQADRLGIGQFEANLIVAAIEHQGVRPARTIAPARNGTFAPLLVVAILQALIAAALWWAWKV